MKYQWIGLATLTLAPLLSAGARAQSADGEILSLGEKLLGQAKAGYEKKDWFDAMELAERARTAFLALSELYASQNRTTDLRKLNDSVAQCNQLVRLARDARKAELEKTEKPIVPDTKPPVPPVVPKEDPAARAPGKLAPPELEAQEKSLKTIRDVFQADYAKTSPADRQALARKLLKEALATRGDIPAQFVLFRQSIDLSAQAGDLAAAFGAVEEVGKEFEVDPLALKVAILSRNPTPTTHELADPAVEGCLTVAGDAIRGDQYDLAVFVLKKAEAITRNPVNVTLQARVQARAKEALELQSAREGLKRAEKSLATNPQDPDANMQLGKFHCIMKGDWDRGVPLLRLGSDGELRKLAETEAAAPSGPELRMDLADAWHRLAERETSQAGKNNLIVRSRHWYQLALSGLSGFPKTRVEKLLSDLDEEEQSRWSVNLLKLIDPKRDGVKGDWAFQDKILITPPVEFAKLQVPYQPPDEYDITMIVAKKAGSDALAIGLVGGGRPFYAVLEGGAGSAGGFEIIDGKTWLDNETLYRARVFVDDKPRTVVCRVRRSRVTLSVNGTALADWKADYRRIGAHQGWAVPSKRSLMLGDWRTTYHVSQLWLTPISGQGQKLR